MKFNTFGCYISVITVKGESRLVIVVLENVLNESWLNVAIALECALDRGLLSPETLSIKATKEGRLVRRKALKRLYLSPGGHREKMWGEGTTIPSKQVRHTMTIVC